MSILIDEFITKTKESNITEGIDLADGAGTVKDTIAKAIPHYIITINELLKIIADFQSQR